MIEIKRKTLNIKWTTKNLLTYDEKKRGKIKLLNNKLKISLIKVSIRTFKYTNLRLEELIGN